MITITRYVTIYGAGSIGNHLAHACRNKGWAVTMADVDAEALTRTKNELYPQRYGQWDADIRLVHLTTDCLTESSDLVIIGTPPDAHIDQALKILHTSPPRVMLIEKPLCSPAMENCQDLLALAKKRGTNILVGYNHTLTAHTQEAAKLIKKNYLGYPLYIYATFREHWEGIFKAHPWLEGPQDTYLGFSSRGGGAGGEHSHAVNIWQHFSHLLGQGRIIEVSAMLDMVKTDCYEYDRIMQVSVRSEKGLIGHIVQDVVTSPPQKKLILQGSEGFLEWQVNRDSGHDALRYSNENQDIEEKLFPKTRPDDFKGEIDHLEMLLDDVKIDSPISLEKGLETMLVVAAAHRSDKTKRTVRINYSAGYSPAALELV